MISVYKLKPKFQQLLTPVLSSCYKLGMTANTITWLAILLSIGTGIYCWVFPSNSCLIIIPFALLIRMALNAMDGMMARKYNMQSDSGEILNELGDVISDFFMFAPLLILFEMNQYLLLLFLFLSIINEYTGILGKAISKVRRYEGPMGKSDRALVVSLICLILFFAKGVLPYINYIFIIINFLLVLSTAVRIRNTLKSSQE